MLATARFEADPVRDLLNAFFCMIGLRQTLFGLILTTGLAATLSAQGAAGVEVTEVRFAAVRAAAEQSWWMGEVELQVNPGSGGGAARFAERVRVELQWGVERVSAEGGWRFFRAAATSAALEAGRWVYRFYLPPGVVRMERIERAPQYWAAQVTVNGEVLGDSRRSVGAGISSPEALANFRRQVLAQAPKQDGILLPWYLTSFADGVSRGVPVPLRVEAMPAGQP